MKKQTSKNKLLKLSLLITILVIFTNLIVFFGFEASKNTFTTISIYINVFYLFIYTFLLSSLIETDLNELKKEALYINYPFRISLFFIFLLFTLIISTISLLVINKEAANVTFIFTFFISTISMMFPSIILAGLMFFIVPAYIIPTINLRKNKKSNLNFILILLFIIFMGYSIYNGINSFSNVNNNENQNKHKSAKLTIPYSSKFLTLAKDINNYSKKKMSRDKLDIPFFYTVNSFPYNDYESAERFCNSMNARVPNYLETYNIVFNQFDTFGEKYYWTSNKDGRYDLVLHYKNMSYEIVRRPKDVKPYVYCVETVNENMGFTNKAYFYRDVKKENKETIKSMVEKPFEIEALTNLIGIDKKENQTVEIKPQEEIINKEKKHVNFSVKIVSPEVLKELLQAGYSYNPTLSIRKEYETNDAAFSNTIQKQTNNIRLCYYPFTDYGNLNHTNERQIWQQSFCSPAFDLISQTPVNKTKYEKDSYCYANGGRLPNIPELAGILKTLGLNQTNVKYWTSSKITDSNNTSIPILVYYQDSRFLKVKPVNSYDNDTAQTFCIKTPKVPSKIIANYKSRFANVEGIYYAKEKCKSCHYYEVPDVILQQ